MIKHGKKYYEFYAVSLIDNEWFTKGELLHLHCESNVEHLENRNYCCYTSRGTLKRPTSEISPFGSWGIDSQYIKIVDKENNPEYFL